MTKIISLSKNAMFKAVFMDNKEMLAVIVKAVLEYCNIVKNFNSKDLIIKTNELKLNNGHNRQLVCDCIIKVDDNLELNIEINKSNYQGVTERNMAYIFNIYYHHFKAGDKYKSFTTYSTIQANFNLFPNADNETIGMYMLLNTNKLEDYLSKNLRIINIDIDCCYKMFYNKNTRKDMLLIEKLGAMFYTEDLEDISKILESEKMSSVDKEKFLNDIKEKSKDKDVIEAVKLEETIDYRFEAMRQTGIMQGIEQGENNKTIEMIENMLKKNLDINTISEISGKSIKEIKNIAKKI